MIKHNEDPFDFPMAYCWRAYYAETNDGIYLPKLEPEEKSEPVPFPVFINAVTVAQYQQHQKSLLLLQEKMESHIDKTKPKKYKEYKI